MKIIFAVVFSLLTVSSFADSSFTQCKSIVAKAIYKKYPSIKKLGGSIDLNDIYVSKDSTTLDIGFASQAECSGGVTVEIQFTGPENCKVVAISEMDEQC